MKKRRNLLYGMALLAVLSSCSDDDDPAAVGAESIEMRTEAFAFAPGENMEMKWSAKDTVGIFPEAGGQQLYFPMLSGAGQSAAQFDGGGWNLRQAAKYRAYSPFQGDSHLDHRAIPFSYSGQEQDGNAPTAHLGRYDFMTAVSERQKNGSMTFNFQHSGCVLELELKSVSSFELSHLELLAGDSLFVEAGTFDLGSDTTRFTAVRYTDSIGIGLKHMELGGDHPAAKVYVMLSPADLRGHELKIRAVDQEGFSAAFSLQGGNFEAGRLYRKLLDLEADPENSTTRSVHVKEAGTLKQLLGKSDISNIKKLELSGELNGSDIRMLREIAGMDVNNKSTEGRLQVLDMRKARIVEGGEFYLEKSDYEDNVTICRTENDVIGESFFENTVLQTIWLPESTKKIGKEAFVYCDALSEVNMPEGLESIGQEAFCLCSELVSIEIPESVATMENGVFFLCSKLTTVHFKGNNLRTLPAGTFNQCLTLREVNVPASVETIGGTAFGYCYGLASIRIPAQLKEMGNTVFFNCYALKEVTMPGNQITFGEHVFERCFDMKTLRFTNGGPDTLSGSFLHKSSVAALYLPDSLKVIKENALAVSSIQEVYCFAAEPPVMEAGNLPNAECRIYVPEGSVARYQAAEGWKLHADRIGKLPEGMKNDWK